MSNRNKGRTGATCWHRLGLKTAVAAQLATRTFHDTMFSIRHTNDPMWKATRKTLALAFNPDAIRCAPSTHDNYEFVAADNKHSRGTAS